MQSVLANRVDLQFVVEMLLQCESVMGGDIEIRILGKKKCSQIGPLVPQGVHDWRMACSRSNRIDERAFVKQDSSDFHTATLASFVQHGCSCVGVNSQAISAGSNEGTDQFVVTASGSDHQWR